MKLVGATMILLGAAYGYLVYRRTAVRSLQLVRALADDLRVLQCRVCVQRCPLPAVLTGDLGEGLSGACLWRPLAQCLARGQDSLPGCWERTVNALPLPVAQRLAPLGKLLSVGGETLARAIEEAHSQLLRLAQEQEGRQRIRLQLSAAVSFSAAALLILIFA